MVDLLIRRVPSWVAFGCAMAVAVCLSQLTSPSHSDVTHMDATSASPGQRQLLDFLTQDQKLSLSDGARSAKRSLSRKVLTFLPLGDYTYDADLPCKHFMGCCDAPETKTGEPECCKLKGGRNDPFGACEEAEKSLCLSTTDEDCHSADYQSSMVFFALPGVALGIIFFLFGIIFWIGRCCCRCGSCTCCGGMEASVDRKCPMCCCGQPDANFEGYIEKQIKVPRIGLIVVALLCAGSFVLAILANAEFSKYFERALSSITDVGDLLVEDVTSLQTRLDQPDVKPYMDSGDSSWVTTLDEVKVSADEAIATAKDMRSTIVDMDKNYREPAFFYIHTIAIAFVVLAAIGGIASKNSEAFRHLLWPAATMSFVVMFVLFLVFGLLLALGVLMSDMCDGLDDGLVKIDWDELTMGGVDFDVSPVNDPLHRNDRLSKVVFVCQQTEGRDSAKVSVQSGRDNAISEASLAFDQLCGTDWTGSEFSNKGGVVSMPVDGQSVLSKCSGEFVSDPLTQNINLIGVPNYASILTQCCSGATTGCDAACLADPPTTTIDACADSGEDGPCPPSVAGSIKTISTELRDGLVGGEALLTVMDEQVDPLLECFQMNNGVLIARKYICIDLLGSVDFLTATSCVTAVLYLLVWIFALMGIKRFVRDNDAQIICGIP